MKREKAQQFPILHHRYIVMNHNEHELPQLRQFSFDNQFDLLTIRTLSIIDTPNDASYEQMIPNNPNYRAYEYRNGQRVHRRDYICEKAFTQPTVLADGTVAVCSDDYAGYHSYGTLANGSSFKDIWWGKKAEEIRRTVKKDLEAFSVCRNCPYRDRPITDCSIQRFDLRSYQV